MSVWVQVPLRLPVVLKRGGEAVIDDRVKMTKKGLE